MEEIIQLLTAERDKLNRAIEALKGATGKRRGRPPKTEVVASQPRKKRKFTAAQRKAAAARMKARWAAKKAGKKSAK